MSKSIEESFIEYIGTSLPLFEKKTVAYRFQCPYCQSSGKDKKGTQLAPSDAKGYFYKYGSTNNWNFKCHNDYCHINQSFEKFLADQYPLLHVSYVRLRDQLGTTGFQTNCPSLETLLKQQGTLSTHPPVFVPRDHQQRSQQAPRTPSAHSAQKVSKLPPMRSPQQQAGSQSRLNHLMKQRQQQRRLREEW